MLPRGSWAATRRGAASPRDLQCLNEKGFTEPPTCSDTQGEGKRKDLSRSGITLVLDLDPPAFTGGFFFACTEAAMTHATHPTKEQVRDWLRRQLEERRAPPPPEQVRADLDWHMVSGPRRVQP